MNANMIPFYSNWSFLLTDLHVTMGEIESRKTRFAPVELPHDWLIYDAKNLYQDGCGWYRKEFELSTGEIKDMDVGNAAQTADAEERITARIHRGERVILRFDGVYMDSTVYINGTRIGGIIPAFCSGPSEMKSTIHTRTSTDRILPGG